MDDTYQIAQASPAGDASPIRESGREMQEFWRELTAAKMEFPAIPKIREGKVSGENRDGRRYEYAFKYADLADILNAVTAPLGRHGLTITQGTTPPGGTLPMMLTTRITHWRGGWIECDYPVGRFPDKANAHQVMGANLTYARRYSLCPLLGIAAEEDIDGGEGDVYGGQPPQAPPPPQERRQRQQRPAAAPASPPPPAPTQAQGSADTYDRAEQARKEPPAEVEVAKAEKREITPGDRPMADHRRAMRAATNSDDVERVWRMVNNYKSRYTPQEFAQIEGDYYLMRERYPAAPDDGEGGLFAEQRQPQAQRATAPPPPRQEAKPAAEAGFPQDYPKQVNYWLKAMTGAENRGALEDAWVRYEDWAERSGATPPDRQSIGDAYARRNKALGG